jgi:hypothetical protein
MSENIQQAPPHIPEVGEKKCPNCGSAIAYDAVICVQCGLDMRTGKHLQTQRVAFQKTWDTGCTGLTIRHRAIAAGIMFFGLNLMPFFLVWINVIPESIVLRIPLFVIALAFTVVLGTCVEMTLMRDSNGRLVLKRAKWMSFVPVQTEVDQVAGFRAARTGYGGNDGFFWSILLISLIASGGLALVLWRNAKYSLCLIRHSDLSEVLIYRGNNAARMVELAEMFKNTAGITLGG